MFSEVTIVVSHIVNEENQNSWDLITTFPLFASAEGSQILEGVNYASEHAAEDPFCWKTAGVMISRTSALRPRNEVVQPQTL
ncbi:hypothetical protein KY290_014345 [Solanum tuberosum]|uniref:Uncharacterized protein n=1 Tax=Solanum tuberosum TaxID=4113 RepID=A0ABQ7VPE3_SOLTU|nr:hypothetical protein KY289_014410 [Solanum tuberosum]KAH0699534.1 hypothetical protein KY284_013749 [Solanum tuberosum]KAH0770364.1 hypothetical protein KY290_014345 [Solanum tuberosum]